jgi:hypothetical protein
MTLRLVAAAPPRANLLLTALPKSERRRLIARCEPVKLTLGHVLYDVGDRIRDVYFPTDSFISVISSVGKDSRLEVGLIGAEGMLGVSVILGVAVSPLPVCVHEPACAYGRLRPLPPR